MTMTDTYFGSIAYLVYSINDEGTVSVYFSTDTVDEAKELVSRFSDSFPKGRTIHVKQIKHVRIPTEEEIAELNQSNDIPIIQVDSPEPSDELEDEFYYDCDFEDEIDFSINPFRSSVHRWPL